MLDGKRGKKTLKVIGPEAKSAATLQLRATDDAETEKSEPPLKDGGKDSADPVKKSKKHPGAIPVAKGGEAGTETLNSSEQVDEDEKLQAAILYSQSLFGIGIFRFRVIMFALWTLGVYVDLHLDRVAIYCLVPCSCIS